MQAKQGTHDINAMKPSPIAMMGIIKNEQGRDMAIKRFHEEKKKENIGFIWPSE